MFERNDSRKSRTKRTGHAKPDVMLGAEPFAVSLQLHKQEQMAMPPDPAKSPSVRERRSCLDMQNPHFVDEARMFQWFWVLREFCGLTA